MSATQPTPKSEDGRLALLYPDSGEIILVMYNSDMAAVFMNPLIGVPTVEDLLTSLDEGVWISLLAEDDQHYTIMVSGRPHAKIPLHLRPPALMDRLHLCMLLANRCWRSPAFDESGELPPLVSVQQLMNPQVPTA